MPSSWARLSQSTLRLLAAFVFVAAHERHGVAAAGIGDRNAGVRAWRRSRRHARDHLEAHALFVQEQRFLAAVIEQERIAPLEPRHGLAFARFLGQQVADRFLIARLGRGAADVDPLGMRRRDVEQVADAPCDRRSRRRPSAGSDSRAG